MSNLIGKDSFYLHPFLRVEGSAQVKTFIEEDDVLTYYYSVGAVSKYDRNFPRDRGALRYLLKKVDLDTLMFAVDRTINLCYDTNTPIVRFIQVGDNLKAGQEALEGVRAAWSSFGLMESTPS